VRFSGVTVSPTPDVHQKVKRRGGSTTSTTAAEWSSPQVNMPSPPGWRSSRAPSPNQRASSVGSVSACHTRSTGWVSTSSRSIVSGTVGEAVSLLMPVTLWQPSGCGNL
jgi:hypothetical protein